MCSICLEENNEKYIFTKGYICCKEEECYSIQCKCNIYVNDDCMRIWINQTKKCPICLSNMNKREFIEPDQSNETHIEIINTATDSNISFLNIKNLFLVIKFTLLWFFIYNLISILSIILKL